MSVKELILKDSLNNMIRLTKVECYETLPKTVPKDGIVAVKLSKEDKKRLGSNYDLILIHETPSQTSSRYSFRLA